MEVSPQLAEIHQKAKDAWHGAKALWSYVTILVPRDPEKKTRPAREVAWRANVLRSKAAEAGAALATAPIYLAAVANGDDAHAKAIEFGAHVLSAIPAGGEAYHGKRLDTDEMVQDFRYAPYTEESIAGVWDELLVGFAAVAPPDETLLAKMESQIAKAEVIQRQTPSTSDKDAPPLTPEQQAWEDLTEWAAQNLAVLEMRLLSHLIDAGGSSPLADVLDACDWDSEKSFESRQTATNSKLKQAAKQKALPLRYCITRRANVVHLTSNETPTKK